MFCVFWEINWQQLGLIVGQPAGDIERAAAAEQLAECRALLQETGRARAAEQLTEVKRGEEKGRNVYIKFLFLCPFAIY